MQLAIRKRLMSLAGWVLYPAIMVHTPCETAAQTQAVTASVDGTQSFQTIDGFGVSANDSAWGGDQLKPVLDALRNEGGMTLFRVVHENSDWEAVNDNADPNVMNLDYYSRIYSSVDFERLWQMLSYLSQTGTRDGVVLNFQGPGPDWLGGFTLNDGDEGEWAEMVASLLWHARYVRGIQFSLVGPDNEPDVFTQGIGISDSGQYVTALRALAAMLDSHGLGDLRLVGPDDGTTDLNRLSDMISDPVVLAKVGHFGLHSYQPGGAGSAGVDDLLQGSAPDKNFWMTEFNVWCEACENSLTGTNTWEYARDSAEYLLGHLANGAAAGLVWEGYDSYSSRLGHWSYWGLCGVDDINALPLTFSPRKTFYTLAQIARFVRPGAVRVGCADSSSSVPLLAFYHPETGQVTIAGVNRSSSALDLSISLAGLPPLDHLDLAYTDASTNLAPAGSFPVSNNTADAIIPPDCVFALTGVDPARTVVSVQITKPAADAVFASGSVIELAATATSATGSVASVAIYAGPNLLAQGSTESLSAAWTNPAPGHYRLTAWATNTSGLFAVSEPVTLHVTGPPTWVTVTPSMSEVPPSGSQPFSAFVVDGLGQVLTTSPLVWTVSGGGVIDSTGTFSALDAPGGPFDIGVTAGAVSAHATVTVSTNANAALAGRGLTWYALTEPSNDAPHAAGPGLNDGDLTIDVSLFPDGEQDFPDRWEAAGILWSAPVTLNRVVFNSGSYLPNHDGVFAAGFGLQFSMDGTSWADAGPDWQLTPAYIFNSALSAQTNFVFAGGIATVRGVRCIGQVHTSPASTNSWMALATEVQAFAAPALPPPRLRLSVEASGLALSWPKALTNYIVEEATSLSETEGWAPLTNAVEATSNEVRVLVTPTGSAQFFRLRSQ